MNEICFDAILILNNPFIKNTNYVYARNYEYTNSKKQIENKIFLLNVI